METMGELDPAADLIPVLLPASTDLRDLDPRTVAYGFTPMWGIRADEVANTAHGVNERIAEGASDSVSRRPSEPLTTSADKRSGLGAALREFTLHRIACLIEEERGRRSSNHIASDETPCDPVHARNVVHHVQ